MPALVRKREGKYRVMEKKNGHLVLVKRNGTPVDGGGHRMKRKAEKQARAINSK